jgi:hypothetical protein
MLAAQTESHDDGDAIMEQPIKQRKSMLKKTFKAIGKVKPKFKKNKNKSLSHNMELMNSCGSFDFELTAEDLEDEDVDDDDFSGDDEDEDAELEESAPNKSDILDPPDHQEDATNNSEGPRVATPLNRSDSADDDEEITCSPQSPPSKETSKLKEEKNNITPRAPETSGQDNMKSTRRSSRKSRKNGSEKKSGSRSTIPPGTPNSGSRVSGQALASPSQKNVSPSRGKESVSPTETSGTKSGHSEERAIPRFLIQGPPLHLPNCIREEREDDDDEDNDESLNRLSKAFGDNSAMGGYFAKLQEIKHKDPAKPHSYSSRPAEQKIAVAKPSSERDLGKTKEEKGSRHFKPKKNIKKLLGLKRTQSTHEKSTAPRKEDTTIPKSKDEAAALMLEFSTMLSANKVDGGDRPMKAHSARPTRTFVFDETDGDGDSSISQEFPDIPTEKRTSLSDIRRMMDSSKGAAQSGPSQITRHHSSQRPTHDDSRSTKTPRELHRKASTEKPATGMEETKSLILKKTEKDSESPSSVADVPMNSQATPIEEIKQAPSPPPATDEKLLSPRSRRHRSRNMKKVPSDSSEVVKKESSSIGKCPMTVTEELEELLESKQTSLESSGRSRRSASTAKSADETVHDNGEATETAPKKENASSQGASRSRKGQRRPGSKRESVNPQSQTASSSAQEGADQAVQNSDTGGDGSLAKDRTTRRSRKPDLKGRASPEMKNHRSPKSNKEDRQKHDARSASTSNIGRPPLSSSESSSRGLSKPPTHSSTESQKASNPSLAKSLEEGLLSKNLANDGQFSVSTDGGSEMFVNNPKYSKIRSDDSVCAPQLVIGSNDTNKLDLGVKNV